jgi:hypothetical protein
MHAFDQFEAIKGTPSGRLIPAGGNRTGTVCETKTELAIV